MKQEINGKDLLALGFQEGKVLGLALGVIAQHFATQEREEVLTKLQALVRQPENYLDDEVLEELATKVIEAANAPVDDTIALKEEGERYAIYGADHIDPGARQQMAVAMKLPVTAGGALMADAHQGYGLPIGGVLATKNAIIPYGVGVDIGCRMALSIFDIPAAHFYAHKDIYQQALMAHTKFGAGHGYHGSYRSEHVVLDRQEFRDIAVIKSLHEKAYSQLGTSGGGNHFVEWGIITFAERDEVLNIEAGKYLALLTHSGSRGMGATIAGYYTRLAKQLCKLPKEAANLAYLDLDSEAGQEYWLAMNLAGDFASACHEVIHNKLAAATGATLLAKVENHHNFAWKEVWHGEEVIVHRKGATPAGKGVMGIIPGSMTAPGFLVRGKGEEASLHSASHGAGRQMSRTKALQHISKEDMRAVLAANDVTLIGSGLDEAPMAYKDINLVMAAQRDLVDIVAQFDPKIVRMADDGSAED
ncbi:MULTISPECIES: RtcB family protein [Chitinophaga]|uniref:RtcB family protein n=1 Tax=Chitinophaga TaxID=79328 RepID=UPI000BAFEB9D|nr:MULTISPECIES: RtcB family protein [Chitinophaga]ASZ10742.1 RNA-splicing ligase RtcB [Chitinophaga sp. MD30]